MEFKNIIILFSTILIALILQVSTSEHFADDCTESKVLCKEGVYAEKACYSFKQAECLLKDYLNFTNIFTTTANWEKHVADKIAGFNETMNRQISAELEAVNERLNKSIYEQFEVISNDVNKTEGGIQKLNDILDNLSNSTDHVNQEVSKMNSSISELRTNLVNQKQEMSTELDKRDAETTKFLEHNLETLKSDLKELNLIFVETNSSLSNRIADMEAEIWIYEKIHNQVVSETTNQLNELRNKTTVIEKYLAMFRYDIKSVKEEIEKGSYSVFEMKERTENNTKATEDSLKNLQNEFDKALECFMLSFMMICLVVSVNSVILLCCVIIPRSTSAMTGQWATGTGDMPGNHRASRSPLEVMDKLDFSRSLRQRRGLEAGISLVYFNGDVAPVITKVMLQISEHLSDHLSQQQVSQYHIRRHDDIPGIPHSKLCFMFAEFHKRHVIIGEPGLGLGDLKRSTVTAIEKLGAKLVILYVLHPKSRRLHENELFHDAIYCTRKQPEVKKFADDERFLSLYDKCTEFQTENLVKIIKDTIF